MAEWSSAVATPAADPVWVLHPHGSSQLWGSAFPEVQTPPSGLPVHCTQVLHVHNAGKTFIHIKEKKNKTAEDQHL